MASSSKFQLPFARPVAPDQPERQSPGRNHLVAVTGEFVGTFMFLLMAFLGHKMAASQASDFGPNGAASSQTVVFISMCYGVPLLVNTWAFYRISGGQFNPAVTLGLVLSGNLPPIRGAILVPAQLLGGICAAAVASGIVPGDIAGVQTSLADGVSVAQGLFIEMVRTT